MIRKSTLWPAMSVAALSAILSSAPLSSQTTSGRQFYAAPSGSPGGDGSWSQPLDLQSALSSSGPLRPGDTLWLRAGRYLGSFTSSLAGTATAPIVVRQYPGERATLDGAGSMESTLTINGRWTWYWGFEVMDSDTQTGHHYLGIPSVRSRTRGRRRCLRPRRQVDQSRGARRCRRHRVLDRRRERRYLRRARVQQRLDGS